MLSKLLTDKNKLFSRRMIAIVGGSFCFMLMKAGLVLLIKYFNPTIPAWFNYLIVTTSVTLIGWAYHATISFQTGFTKQSLRRYVIQAIVLKALDYGLFNTCFYVLGIWEPLSVVATSGIVFTLRVLTYFKWVFVPEEPAAEDTESTASAPVGAVVDTNAISEASPGVVPNGDPK